MSKEPKFKRILLKLSGEALAGEKGYGIEASVLEYIANEIKSVLELGCDVGIVVGGGNIFRGVQGSEKGMDRSTGDYMGMLATVINGLAMQDALERMDIQTRVQSAIRIEQVVEPYIRRKATRHLEKDRVVIFAGGTGNPYFSTDTAASLRAMEIDADLVVMAKKGVDGVYDSDPRKNKDAKRFDDLGYMEVLNKKLDVMDSTAVSLCMDNKVEMIVYDMNEEGALKKIVEGSKIGTSVHN